MRCPKCDSENNDSAKFCKKCGTPLKGKPNSHDNMVSSMNEAKSSGSDTTKIIIVALIVVAIVLAGSLVYIYGFGSNQSDDSQQQQASDSQSVDSSSDNDDSDDTQEAKVQSTQTAKPAQSSTASSITILGGSFSTGSAEEDKTYASIYVGPEHAGESLIVQIYYSRDGNSLNNGNMVPITVDSGGYIDVASADAYHYYPDYATINIYDSNSKLLTTQSVSLSPTSGTQNF